LSAHHATQTEDMLHIAAAYPLPTIISQGQSTTAQGNVSPYYLQHSN